MNDKKPDIEAIVDLMGRVFGVTMSEESRVAVILHLEIALGMAPFFMDFALADEAEPATVYAP